MKKVPQRTFVEFAAACRRVAASGLLRCSSGNMSWRINPEQMLVTPTRAWLGDLRAGQVALVRIADGAPLNDRKPSVETGFHAGVLRARTDMNVVLHCQTPYATTLACTDPTGIDFFVIPEIPYYIGAVAVVPYRPPGSAQLARAVIAALKSHDLALLRNHGEVTVGTHFDDAIQKATFFELACEIIVHAGNAIRPLAKKAVAPLLHRVRVTSRFPRGCGSSS